MENNFDEETLESMNQAQWYNRWTLKKFKKFLKGQILEVGCGIGNFTKILSEYGQVWGIDIEKKYVEQTQKIVGSKGKIGLGNIESGEYFFKDESFDAIVCLNVLEHIRYDNQAISNFNKLLKSDGTLILLVPAHPFLYGEIDRSINHFRRYTKKDITSKLKDHRFKIVHFRSLNLLGAVGWFISGKVLKNKTVDQSKIKLFNLFAPIFLSLEDLVNFPLGTSFLIIAKKQ